MFLRPFGSKRQSRANMSLPVIMSLSVLLSLGSVGRYWTVDDKESLRVLRVCAVRMRRLSEALSATVHRPFPGGCLNGHRLLGSMHLVTAAAHHDIAPHAIVLHMAETQFTHGTTQIDRRQLLRDIRNTPGSASLG